MSAHIRRLAKSLAGFAIAAGTAIGSAQATPQTFTFNNATFVDGGTINGSLRQRMIGFKAPDRICSSRCAARSPVSAISTCGYVL